MAFSGETISPSLRMQPSIRPPVWAAGWPSPKFPKDRLPSQTASRPARVVHGRSSILLDAVQRGCGSESRAKGAGKEEGGRFIMPPFCPYVCLSVCLFVGLLVRLFLCLSLSLSFCLCLGLCVSVSLRDIETKSEVSPFPERVTGEGRDP